jgi:hypothetical protein
MRVLVCGGRYFEDGDFLHNTLCELDQARGPITCIIHGAARGADRMAMGWAQMMDTVPGRSVKHAPFAAEWSRYGTAAGPIRNKRMVDEGKPDLVVAFAGGRGTRCMVDIARQAGVEVIIARPGSRC